MKRSRSPVAAAASGAPILFYSHHHLPYGVFSNFSAHPIRMPNGVFPTTEHYFQCMKFVHSPDDFGAVLRCSSPNTAAKTGRERSRPLRPDWEAVKDATMLDAVYAKFTQHPDIQAVLLSTGDAPIVEHTRNDSYWGDGGDGSGKNMLGQTLMAVRQRIRDELAAKAGKEASAGPSA